ncbi:MAG: 23S rRNA (pseudouridine(1915)-N(3))-methyltransferase RlmH [Chromatiales bacterium]|nr:23S rRNA (pseudouridine(1915)-N(3))-methyltransferase RlmH [Chromatiales bacterium]
MKLTLVAVGTRMPTWVTAGYNEYAARMPRECRLELRELPLGRQRRSGDVARAVSDEGKRMLTAVGDSDYVVALDVAGKKLDTNDLAVLLRDWMQLGRNVSLLIGGPDGLAESCYARSDLRLSLSPLTLPHTIARILISEQLYRAWSILRNHPYHRE